MLKLISFTFFFKVILILIFSLSTLEIFSQEVKHTELYYSDYIQTLLGGAREVGVQDGRVDLVTNDYAFEIEWAYNWKESIGQALWYAIQTNKKPGIILILKSEKDYKYYLQLNTTLNYIKMEDEILVYLFPNDFKKLIKEKNTKQD